MKKYIQIFTVLLLSVLIGFQSVGGVYADNTTDAYKEYQDSRNRKTKEDSGSGETLTYVTEPVIGADCKCVVKNGSGEIVANPLMCGDITNRLYECKVPEGMAGFQSMFRAVIKWIAIVATLLGVLALVALGIAWAVSGGQDSKMKKDLKEWIQNIIIGLAILYTFGFILRFLAPWVYTG
ncbi:hypothetical protein KGV55_02510 [Candidatus Gracilibacteria bacterium]|nr:hypothetical protein [Candidatus Gracilibacteria bacterium]